MKVSLNWIREFTTIDLSKDELLERINAQLGAVDEIVDLSEQYQGILVAKVIECKPHPNADKLKLCRIDDGGVNKDVPRDNDGFVQVVCGAPNVAEGQLVAWLPPGVTVPATFSDVEPLVLDAREIRGEISNGMLASPKELEIGDSHEGLLIIDAEANPGDSFAEVYKLNDIIIDLENKMFTHRPDCFGILGVARELAGIQGVEFKSPEWYKPDQDIPTGEELKISLDNQLPELVPRMTLIALDNVTIKPSPIQLQSYLARVGLKPINNVVDITNFLAHLTAQPMHAFDYDKVASKSHGEGASIVLRHPTKGEQLTLLDGKTIEPHEEAILVCSDQEALAIGGVMGGQSSEVDEHTTRILLEVANFNMYSIRRTSMKHGLFTEASTRFNKGQSPSQIQPAMAHAIDLLAQNADARPASHFIDSDSSWIAYKAEPITVTASFITMRLGKVDLDNARIARHLSDVEFEVVTDQTLSVTPPFWRTDIETPEDIVEEVGRLYGYGNIPQTLPVRSLKPGMLEGTLSLKQRLRELLAIAGANELLTYSFVSEKLMQIAGQHTDQAYEIRNALSPELKYYRMTILPSLLEAVHPNHRANHDAFALFELNKVHNKAEIDASEQLPLEREVLSFVTSVDKKVADQFEGAAFYQAKRYMTAIIESFAIDADYTRLDQYKSERSAWFTSCEKLFIPHRSAVVTIADAVLGIVGEFAPAVRSQLKVPQFAAGFEIDLDVLSHHIDSPDYQSQSRYPAVTFDVTYEYGTDSTHAQAQSVLRDSVGADDLLLTVVPTDLYQKEDSDSVRATWHLVVRHEERTLSSEDIQNVLKELDAHMSEHIHASRV